ncbi:MAG TPA: metallophosphoesterase, partial [Chondromyces sp.]|nr:metallophosphoesterase [Chondromyces sp.]
MKEKLLEKWKKGWLALGMIILVLGSYTFVQGEEESRHEQEKAALVFSVLSDIHVKKGEQGSVQKFQEALRQINEHAPNQDAFIALGDLTDRGAKEEYEQFFNIYNKMKQPQATSLFAIGNHEYRDGLSISKTQERFLQMTGMEALYFHKKIKGYDFIVLGPESGLTKGYYSQKQIDWLSGELEKAAQQNPNKPIFVFLHHPMKNTVYGSKWTSGEEIYQAMKKFPQVVAFSGHTHYPLEDPRSIHQKDFTSIATSSVSYLWPGPGYLQGELTPENQLLSQGLIVEVFKDRIVINKRDFHKNDWTNAPWEVVYPINKNEFVYTEKRDQIKPEFLMGSYIRQHKEKTTANSLEVSFTQAVDNLLVHSYKVIVTERKTGKRVKEFKALSEFYKDPVPNPMTLPIQGLKAGTTYTIKIVAIDAFGNESSMITGIIR